MAYTQDNKLIAITTPLGKDVLLLAGFRGAEGLSRLFSFNLDMLSENHSISFDSIIGKNVTVSVVLADGSNRFFNGIIASFSQGRGGDAEGGDPRFSHYRAAMVPWLWLLTRTADSRIFQKLKVPDIVEKIFKEKGFSDFKVKLQGSYPQREYCVQYRETDFNFVSRLLEEEGIHYFFEHEDGKHTLVLADSPQANMPCPKQNTARYQLSAGGWLEEDVITALEKQQEIRPAQYTLNDFNFETPNTDLKANVPTKQKLGPGEREIYDYPGFYSKKAEGDRYARIRMEEEEAQITTLSGSSNCRAFTSGYRFSLSAFYRKDINNKDYVLTALQHSASQGYQGESDLSYSNHFTCIPFDVPFRPPRVTPKPVVEGTQTAIVVGPSGEEIYTDEHARVKVQFHWDREGKKDENSSCWIRVAQLWAGAKWGAMFIPRIGQEVIVDFLEGDPDRPIITGRVYHGNNKPPYPLPDEKTKSTIKTDSSQGGGGCNEIRFEDKKGKEQLFFQAEKQQDNRVKEDSLEWIGRDRHLIVTQDQMEQVGGDKHLTVKGDQNEKVDGTVSLTAGMDIQRKAQMKYALDTGMEIHLKAGMNIVLEAGMSITLKAGGGFVVIGPAGVTISGTPVLINSGGAAGSGSGASPGTPVLPKEADKAKPGEKVKLSPPATAPSPAAIGPQAQALNQAAQSGTPFCAT
jgi:type VI secretion system secreted protein VgrG